ncbi:hypothetical protein SISSUDRAFT_203474 [Sistotremastrum suecicum HHB10207 ss-3]|uniref:Uncharacterized protein n=1 Tax=Sistotremastrum suecicum HHB10207 ss-3 TaxID=1314776 RepID=A0A166GL76_9AGAM|nr:hypothetical protein SISSUDRAFT_203474 [Sistotremastrum suecicum HHB10207 ss-3]
MYPLVIQNLFNDLLATAGLGVPNSVATLWGLGQVRFSTQTGGTVPQGPTAESPLDTTGLSSQNQKFNSSMSLQGLNVQVTCDPVLSAPMKITQSRGGSQAFPMANITFVCDGEDVSETSTSVPLGLGAGDGGDFVALTCDQPQNATNLRNRTLYIGNLNIGIGTGSQSDSDSVNDSDIFGNLTCNVSAMISEGILRGYSTDIGNVAGWFNLSWNDVDDATGSQADSASSLSPAWDIGTWAIQALSDAFTHAQTSNGNLFIQTYQTMIMPLIEHTQANYTASGKQRAAIDGFSDMLAGVIQYEVSI